jgi:hypothetical protein
MVWISFKIMAFIFFSAAKTRYEHAELPQLERNAVQFPLRSNQWQLELAGGLPAENRRYIISWDNSSPRMLLWSKIDQVNEMKTTLCMIAAIALSGSAVSQVPDTDTSKTPTSVVEPLVTEVNPQDEIAPPTPTGDPAQTQVSPSDQAAVQTQPAADQPMVVEGPLMNEYPPTMVAPAVMVPAVAPAATCCTTCNRTTCCCPPPPPTSTVFCLVDPCGGTHKACIRVPACCAGEQPRVSWRRGILGRQIATVCWECCGHRATVIVTCFGKVRVR